MSLLNSSQGAGQPGHNRTTVGNGTSDATENCYEVEAEMGFAPIADIQPDKEFPDRFRLPTHPITTDPTTVFDFKACKIRDCSDEQSKQFNLQQSGFETLDLSTNKELQTLLAGVNVAGHLSTAAATQLRRLLRGQSFRLNNGKRLRLLYVAPEGLILRQAGPNGLKITANKQMSDANGHEGAVVVHGDQDILGTPLKQIMRGLAPWFFAHDAPYSQNKKSPLHLVNIWIPLQQTVRPLTLMDRRTLDMQKHQIRYALPIDTILDRDDDNRSLNDIWMYLFDENQRWYFSSDMDHRQAYVFDTLGTPHGAFFLPGEDVAEFYYQQLHNLRRGMRKRDERLISQTLKAVTAEKPPELAENTLSSLQQSIHKMKQSLEEAVSIAAQQPPLIAADIWQEWNRRAEQAMTKVVRRSIEMRVVALVLP